LIFPPFLYVVDLVFDAIVCQPLAPGKYENSIWEGVQADATIVDRELIKTMFKMTSRAAKADALKKRSNFK
jgi:hypothetical protein